MKLGNSEESIVSYFEFLVTSCENRGRADLEHNRNRTKTTGLRHFRAKIESNKHGIPVSAKQIEDFVYGDLDCLTQPRG